MPMSKPPSKLFQGTKGELAYYGNAEIIIAKRVVGLDLREHPLTKKQLRSVSRKRIKKKIVARTATREEYKYYMWDKRLTKRRNQGVANFWKEEQKRLRKLTHL